MITIGKLGIWFSHNAMSMAESVAFAQRVEACGYGALWIPRSDVSLLCTWPISPVRRRLVLATGIATSGPAMQ
jgi:hypothetical protein